LSIAVASRPASMSCSAPHSPIICTAIAS
jgi:hypothetical protein